MPEETRVFDVAKPGSTGPGPNSKPVIVGHRPTGSDPMVRDENPPTHIVVQGAHQDETNSSPSAEPTSDSQFGEIANPFGETSVSNEPKDDISGMGPAAVPDPVFPTEQSEAPGNGPANRAADDPEPAVEPTADMPETPVGHVEELHLSPQKRRKNPLMWIILIILLILAAGYLLIDSGTIKSSLKMPYHIFKQKTVVVTPPKTAAPAQSQASPVPLGFTQYKLAGTNVTFAAPTAWGQPNSSQDQGYTARGGTNKPDATYAYLVDFTTNKDIELAVTSSKVLPPARGALYYDFLQWCTGTSDSKTYLSVLRFNTDANKIDTPSTITCDQGPITDATKLDANTIVELKAATKDGKIFGDLYTKNLKNPDLPVFRVKDQAMTNSDNIKKLLATVQVTAPTSSSPSSQ